MVRERVSLRGGAEHVLVFGLDAHCDGGTVAVLDGDRRFRHVDVSVDTIEHTPASVPNGWTDAVVYTNGVDPHQHDIHGASPT